MSDREALARKLAEVTGWGWNANRRLGCFVNELGGFITYFPPPDAPLHEHLAFVGRVAETLPEGWELAGVTNHLGRTPKWWVGFCQGADARSQQYKSMIATDLSAAAAKARIEVG